MGEKEYMLMVSTEAYESVGRKNMNWNEAVKRFLERRVLASIEKTNTVQWQEVNQALSEVEKAGCDDPLVQYLALRQRHDPQDGDVGMTNAWAHAAERIQESAYPVYWKFYSAMRADQAIKKVVGSTNTPMVHHYRHMAGYALLELAKDKRVPTEVIYTGIKEFMIDHLGGAEKMRKWVYDEIENDLFSNWGDTAEAWALKGGYYVNYAWDARGSGWASTVTKEGWKLFEKRIETASEALEKSWRLKPTEFAAREMLTVTVAQNSSRKEMEKWFQRGMELNPASHEMAMGKLMWLEPKWHGSEEELRKFGWECIRDPNWKGNVPLIMWDVHIALANWYQKNGRSSEAEYWMLPGVWEEVRASFERFFELNPEEIGWRHDYAMAAYKSEAWDDLAVQIGLMGPINYKFFGGKEGFAKMVRETEEHTGKKLRREATDGENADRK
jgi:hypothetical protein